MKRKGKRIVSISVRVTPEEYEELFRLAKAQDRPVASLVRLAALAMYRIADAQRVAL